MALSSNQAKFLGERRRLARFFRPLTFVVMLVAWIVFVAWQMIAVPLLANPWHVRDSLLGASLEPGTRDMLALLAPILYLVLAFVIAVLFVFCAIAARHEARYLAIVERLSTTTPSAPR